MQGNAGMRPEDILRAKLLEKEAMAAGHGEERKTGTENNTTSQQENTGAENQGGQGGGKGIDSGSGREESGSTRWSKESLHSCYCFNVINEMTTNYGLLEGVYEVYFSNGDVCTSQLYQYLLAKYLLFAAVALVSALNIVIQEGAKSLVNFERHKSKTAAAAQQQLKTFIGLLVNTGFIVVVVNSPFASGISFFFFDSFFHEFFFFSE